MTFPLSGFFFCRHSFSASLVPTDSPKRSGKLNKTQVGLKESVWVSVCACERVCLCAYTHTSVIECQSN